MKRILTIIFCVMMSASCSEDTMIWNEEDRVKAYSAELVGKNSSHRYMKVHVFVTMVSKSALKSPNLLPSFTKTAISLNDGIQRMRTQNGSIGRTTESLSSTISYSYYEEG